MSALGPDNGHPESIDQTSATGSGDDRIAAPIAERPVARVEAPEPAALAVPSGVPYPASPTSDVTTSRRRTRLWIGVAAVVALAGVAGGIVLASRSTHHAPAHTASRPATPAPAAPSTPQFGTNPDGTHYGPLTSFLLPIPHGYAAGPDVGYFGDDGAITPQQLATSNNELMRELGAQLGLPQRVIDKGLISPAQAAKIVRAAVISYVSNDDDLDVSILLQQYAHSSNASANAIEMRQELDDITEDFGRSDFAVPGYRNARCGYVWPKGGDADKLDRIQCVAVSGDVVTVLQAAGVAPISQHGMSALMADQLKLLQSEGTSA